MLLSWLTDGPKAIRARRPYILTNRGIDTVGSVEVAYMSPSGNIVGRATKADYAPASWIPGGER